MKRVLVLGVVVVAGALIAGCASGRGSAQAKAGTDEHGGPPPFETGWQRPDPTGTAFFKEAVSGGAGVVRPW
jgi:hypothetical protein